MSISNPVIGQTAWRTTKPRNISAILLLLLPLSLSMANEARVIQLKHRPAQELIPVVRPLLDPGDLLQGMDYRLIVRTSDKNMREIERILAQLDVARRNLTITVKQAATTNATRRSHVVSGEKRVGERARVTLTEPPSTGDHGLIVAGDKPDSPRLRIQHTKTAARDDHSQVLRVLDGSRAFVRIGQSIPHVEKILRLSGHQAILAQGVVLQNVVTGFEVLPHAFGDRVRVEITPRLSTLADPSTGLVNLQALTTTVETKFGEWVDLGGITGTDDDIHRAILESAGARTDERHTILMRID
jgi:hypothetical protein